MFTRKTSRADFAKRGVRTTVVPGISCMSASILKTVVQIKGATVGKNCRDTRKRQ